MEAKTSSANERKMENCKRKMRKILDCNCLAFINCNQTVEFIFQIEGRQKRDFFWYSSQIARAHIHTHNVVLLFIYWPLDAANTLNINILNPGIQGVWIYHQASSYKEARHYFLSVCHFLDIFIPFKVTTRVHIWAASTVRWVASSSWSQCSEGVLARSPSTRATFMFSTLGLELRTLI